MIFTFKDSYNNTTGTILLESGDVVSRDSDSDITGVISINVPYSVKAWDAVRSASHFEDTNNHRAKIKIISIEDSRLIIRGIEVNTIL